MIAGFIVGLLVGTVLTAIALIWALGTTSDDPLIPTELLDRSRDRLRRMEVAPHQAIERPLCPTCWREMYPIKSAARPGQTGWECDEHGVACWVDVR